ncbi:MAG: hypothetical protein JJU36_01740 [Phycisphaeraceae bacterium]|nr:hypothetical protein [Phycisphaeraceae bacterium]
MRRKMIGSAAVVGALVWGGLTAPNTANANPYPLITPSLGTAIVDGVANEWDLAEDFFAPLYRAGKSTHPVEGSVHLRWDAENELLYALVLPNPGQFFIREGGGVGHDDTFIKLGHSNKLIDADAATGFAWIDPSTYGIYDIAYGWEAVVSLEAGFYGNLNIHSQTFADGEDQTAAVENRAIEIYLPPFTPSDDDQDPVTPPPQDDDPVAVPEPVSAGLALLGLGGVILAGTRRRRI